MDFEHVPYVARDPDEHEAHSTSPAPAVTMLIKRLAHNRWGSTEHQAYNDLAERNGRTFAPDWAVHHEPL